jgi:hypothetical protein
MEQRETKMSRSTILKLSILGIVAIFIACGFACFVGFTYAGINIMHDNHLFIKSYSGDLTHHPECPNKTCKK